jgi:hypothetical protein
MQHRATSGGSACGAIDYDNDNDNEEMTQRTSMVKYFGGACR